MQAVCWPTYYGDLYVRFIKMHGIGNDFVFLDALAEPVLAARTDLPRLARMLTDRRTGVGADGLIVLAAPPPGVDAELMMMMLNSDGSDGGMCGNGARCAAKFAVDRGYVMPGAGGGLRIAAGNRLLSVSVRTDQDGKVRAATVDMGEPAFDLKAMGVDPKAFEEVTSPNGQATEYAVGSRMASMVSMGNPHMVAFIDEPVEIVDLVNEGPMFELHPAFRERMNYHIVNVISPTAVAVRTWERGVGITHGCGSGACAVAAAAIRSGRADRALTVHMVGGDIEMYWDEKSNRLFMTGPAVESFQGEWPIAVASPAVESTP